MSSGKHKRAREDQDDKLTSLPETEEEEGGPSAAKRIRLDHEEKRDPPETSIGKVNPVIKKKKTLEEEERERLQLLVSAFSNAQQDQYEIYRRSTFPKTAIKKIMQSVSGNSVPQNAVIAMAGITKVYVGELVEEACQAKETMKEEGPLQPKHIREAVRKLKNNNKVPNSRYKKVFPFR